MSERLIETDAMAVDFLDELAVDLSAAGLYHSQVLHLQTGAEQALVSGNLVRSGSVNHIAVAVVTGAIQAAADTEAALPTDSDKTTAIVAIATSVTESLNNKAHTGIVQSVFSFFRSFLPGKSGVNAVSTNADDSYAAILQNVAAAVVENLDDGGIQSDQIVSAVKSVVSGISSSLIAAGIDKGDAAVVAKSIALGAVGALNETGVASSDLDEAVKSVVAGALVGLKTAGLTTGEIAGAVDKITEGAVKGLEDAGISDDQYDDYIDTIKTAARQGLKDAGLTTAEVNAAEDAIEEGALDGKSALLDNERPVADDQTVSVDEDGQITVVLSATDAEGEALTFAVDDQPTHGSLSGTPPNLIYVPDADYFGTDSIIFSANDGVLDSKKATCAITIKGINDTPIVADQTISTSEDVAKPVTLEATDVDGDDLAFTLSDPAHGVLSGTAPSLTYTPTADYHGKDSFTYQVNDGEVDSGLATISLTIASVNDAPEAEDLNLTVDENSPKSFTLAASDVEGAELTYTIVTQPSHGTLSGNAPNLTYTPEIDYNGSDSFTYKVYDGELYSAEATGSITVQYSAKTGAPIFSPAAGTYHTDQTIEISSATYGATIYYTTDGGTPNTGSSQYTSPISVTGDGTSVTIKAKAVKSGKEDSAMITAEYVINYDRVDAPVFNPAAGTYGLDQSVVISTATSGAEIYYTTDGSTPTSGSTPYDAAITVAGHGSTMTIKAVAVKSGQADSETVSAEYVINYDKVSSPEFSSPAGDYNSDQNIALTTSTSGATIHYTTDGSTPTTDSDVYAGAIAVAGHGAEMTIKALAVKSGKEDSEITTAVYTITYDQISTPQFSPTAGTYDSGQSIEISTTSTGVTIYYTLDGNTPTTGSDSYVSAISIAGHGTSQTIKALAVKSGMLDSEIGSASYTIAYATVATPTFSKAGGTYQTDQTVTLSCSTPGATLYYTDDGNTPTTASIEYTSPISISGHGTSKTIRVVAIKSGMLDSDVGSAAYEIKYPAAAPTFSPDAGTYSDSQTMTISTATGGAVIEYTTDGTPPTTSNSAKTSAGQAVVLAVDYSTEIKAYARHSGYSDSEVTTALIKITRPLPDTGQTGDYTSTAGEDSDFSINPPSYTNNGNGTVTDDITNLTWQRENTVTKNWADALKYCDDLNLAGLTDWRLPSKKELLRIVNYGSSDPAIDAAAFPNTLSANYWSATVYALDSWDAWVVSFTHGETATARKSLPYNFRCARERTFLVDRPTFTPDSGSFTSSQTVTIATAAAGAKVTYTTDGSDPKTAAAANVSTAESEQISIESTTTVKAYSHKEGMTDSEVATASFYIVGEKVPDTGQTTSYTDTFGEDSDFIINAPAFTNNGNGTVTDDITGLVWQRENSNTQRNWSDAVTYCDDMVLGGDSDWRLPTRRELSRIVDFGQSSPSVNALVFPNTDSADYWTTTTYVSGVWDAWAVDFTYGEASDVRKQLPNYVRCVRGKAFLAARPTFSPGPGAYTTGQIVTISTGTAGADVKYTVDGSEPKLSGSAVTAGGTSVQVSVDDDTVLKAYAFKDDLSDSETARAEFAIINQKLPDTGQTTSYTDTFGEDSDFSINGPSYTNNGNGTVTDDVTGLVWIREDSGTASTWPSAVSHCSGLNYAGSTDWRLPVKMELTGIVDYGTDSPAINSAFINTGSVDYWTSTDSALDSSYVWVVGFSYGEVETDAKSNSNRVRCVHD